MARRRKLFYALLDPENHEALFSGLHVTEFFRYLEEPVRQLILLQSDFMGEGFSPNTRFRLVGEADELFFTDDEIHRFGDCCWVDFDAKEHVEQLTPAEVAELLYFGHMFQPLGSPFNDTIRNRFAYAAHDDGWFCRLYSREMADMHGIIARKVYDMVSKAKRRSTPMFPAEIVGQLARLAENGLFIDSTAIVREGRHVEIPFYTVGEIDYMDELYNNIEGCIGRAATSCRLVHGECGWELISE